MQVSPYLLKNPNIPVTGMKITPYGLSKCVPAVIRGCSQFIIEYTGNFYTKDLVGNVANSAPDPSNQLDFYTDARGFKHVRWYGFPRAVNSFGTVNPLNGDVVPLRDVVGTTANAERFSANFPAAAAIIGRP